MHPTVLGDPDCPSPRKRTRREALLAQLEQAIPWPNLLDLIAPMYAQAGNSRPPYPPQILLKVHLLQDWFGLSDAATEEALYEIASMRQFAGLSLIRSIPDAATISSFRRLLQHSGLDAEIESRVNGYLSRKRLRLTRGTVVDTTVVAAAGAARHTEGQREAPAHKPKKGKPWYLGIKGCRSTDADLALPPAATTTAANEAEPGEVPPVSRGEEGLV